MAWGEYTHVTLHQATNMAWGEYTHVTLHQATNMAWGEYLLYDVIIVQSTY